MAEDTVALRKTTRMAIQAALDAHARALNEIARAALEDGEAPEGYILNLDQGVWRKPDIAPKEPTASAQDKPEAVPSSG